MLHTTYMFKVTSGKPALLIMNIRICGAMEIFLETQEELKLIMTNEQSVFEPFICYCSL